MFSNGVGIGMPLHHIQPAALIWAELTHAVRLRGSIGFFAVAVGTVLPAMRGVLVALATLRTLLMTQELVQEITAFVVSKGFSFCDYCFSADKNRSASIAAAQPAPAAVMACR